MSADYRLLPRQHRWLRLQIFFSRTSLYAGPDHLLVVNTGAYNESYERFFYEDLEALQASTHWESQALSALLVLGCLFWLLLSWAFARDGMLWPGLIFAAISFGLELWNLLLGPSCRVRACVAGKWRSLPAWSRLSDAQAGFKALAPYLESAQGRRLDDHRAAAEAMAQEPPSGPLPLMDAPPKAAEAAPEAKPTQSRGALLISAVFFMLSAFYDLSVFSLGSSFNQELSSLLTYAAWGSAIVALALSVRAGRLALWAGLAGLAAVVEQFIGEMIAAALGQMSAVGVAAHRDLASLLMDPAAAGVHIFNQGVALVAALFQLYAVWRLSAPKDKA